MSGLHIAWCGPISLEPLRPWVDSSENLPAGYISPLGTQFVEELMRTGHEVTVVTTDVGIRETRRFAGERMRIVAVPRRTPRQCARDLFRAEVKVIASELQTAKPQVVHAQWTYEFADAALRSRLPMVTTAHDSAPAIFRHLRDRYRFVRLVYSYLVVPRIRTIALPSPYLARQYRTWYLRRRSHVVPNGLGDHHFRQGTLPEKRERTTIAAITGWDDRKNPKTLLRAFARARAALPALRLIVFGGGFDSGAAGAKWAEAEGLHHGVEFRGSVSHETAMDALNQEADLFVHTTLEESFCMAIVEAMAAGVPVVAGRHSGAVPWLLEEGRCGVLVDVKSPEAVAAGMLELARNPDRGTGLAQSALQRAREKFGLRNSVAAYVNLYETAVKSARDGK